MQMNDFGKLFRVTIFGESHGKYVGASIDNCTPGIALNETDFVADIERRKPGNKGTTKRIEEDAIELISGVFNGYTTGAPLSFVFANNNVISKDYSSIKEVPRPGHADFTAHKKYKGFNDYRGSGHFSGRLTLALVAAGVIAKKICKDIQINARLIEAGGNKNIEEAIDTAIKNNDSIGGIIECTIQNAQIGLGEPFFYSLESAIAQLAFAIPAVKGIEFGSGFKAATMLGSEHNDSFIDHTGKTNTNHAGGINGGISNGNNIVFRLAIKPTSSIAKTQNTYNNKTQKVEEFSIVGRHDTCIALRVPVVCEAIAAIALADMLLLYNSKL
jgi:chorismate synthase